MTGFRVTRSAHSVPGCPSCFAASEAAIGTARATGSVGGTYRQGAHSATVTRLSPAEEARQQADASGKAFVEALADAFPVTDMDTAAKLDRLLAQLRADEYEAGHATGYAQHPANRKDV